MNNLDKALSLRAAPLFAELSADSLLPVAELCREMQLADGKVLFNAGDVGDSLYVIVEGTVIVEREGAQLARLGPGECVGEMAALDWEPRSATVRTETQVRLIRLERNDLMDILTDHPPLVRSLAAVLVERIRNTG